MAAQASSREAAQLCQALLDIFSAVLPLARPPALLAEQLDKTLRDMVQRQQYLTVVHAAIRCRVVSAPSQPTAGLLNS